MNLEQLRKQAKDLVRAARSGDPDALRRLDGRDPILARAQLVVAREQGHPSWPALVLAATADVPAFLRAATDGRRRRAEALLAAAPAIARDPWAALALGRVADGPADPDAPGGPLRWPPLVVVCGSCLAGADAVRALLDRGADPSARSSSRAGEWTALSIAARRPDGAPVVRALVDAGAIVDDEDALYHATEPADPAALRILLEAGARTSGTNALAHALDEEHPEHVRTLLDAGADPRESAFVAHAVRRGRSAEVVRVLVQAGADVDAAGGETWRGDVPLRTPYAQAAIRGRDDLRVALAELGADTTLTPLEETLAALATSGADASVSAPAMRDLVETDPDAQEALVSAACAGRVDAVVDAVGVDFRGVVAGSPRTTLLAHAGWVGLPDVVGRLLERGAAVGAVPGDPDHDALGATAVGSAFAGTGDDAVDGRGGGGDTDPHVAVAELLVAAGSTPAEGHLDLADGPLLDWLAERVASP